MVVPVNVVIGVTDGMVTSSRVGREFEGNDPHHIFHSFWLMLRYPLPTPSKRSRSRGNGSGGGDERKKIIWDDALRPRLGGGNA